MPMMGSISVPEYMPFSLDVRQGEFYLLVNPPGTNESRVKGFDFIGRHNDFDVTTGVEAIELVKKLKHRSLNLAFTARCGVVTV